MHALSCILAIRTFDCVPVGHCHACGYVRFYKTALIYRVHYALLRPHVLCKGLAIVSTYVRQCTLTCRSISG